MWSASWSGDWSAVCVACVIGWFEAFMTWRTWSLPFARSPGFLGTYRYTKLFGTFAVVAPLNAPPMSSTIQRLPSESSWMPS